MKNSSALIVSVSNLKDIANITENTKYINLDITNPNHEVIKYFISNGENYKYTDITESINGYNYVDYKTFLKAENMIDIIYAEMPNDLNELEMAKYLYVSLAKCLSFDINTDTAKNELYNLSLITSINNIWGSLAQGSVNDITASKLFYYLCRRLGIEISLVANEENKTALTKLVIKNQVLITDLFEDIPYIQANMHTRHFATYNEDIALDKKIKFINNKYNDYYIDKALKDIDYTCENCVWLILNNTKDLFDINSIKPTELSIIYKYLFDKYCPKYNIKINNLYLNNPLKKHFLLISYNENHYSYNYKKKEFVKVHDNDLIDNLNFGKIGLYQNELIPNINN